MQPVQNYDEISKLQGVKTSWSLWELYRMPPGGDFASSLHKLISFKDLKQFCEIFTFLPHGSPSKIFFDKESMEIKKLVFNLSKAEIFADTNSSERTNSSKLIAFASLRMTSRR